MKFISLKNFIFAVYSVADVGINFYFLLDKSIY